MADTEEMDYTPAEVIDVQSTNGMQAYQQDKAALDMQIVTAKHYPRNLKRAILNCMTIATVNVDVAKACTYTLPKGKKIVGPSVKLARIIAQQMGNMRIETKTIGADKTHCSSEATCWDLENNLAYKSTIKKAIVDKEGDRYSEDLITITMNACAAIAFRNVVFTIVGEDTVNQVWEATKEKVLGKISDEKSLLIRVNKTFEGLKQRYADKKLTDAEILKMLGREVIEHVTREDVMILVGFETSIKDGNTDFDSVFRSGVKPQKHEPPKSEDKERERLVKLMENCKTREQLKKFEKELKTAEERIKYDELFKTLK